MSSCEKKFGVHALTDTSKRRVNELFEGTVPHTTDGNNDRVELASVTQVNAFRPVPTGLMPPWVDMAMPTALDMLKCMPWVVAASNVDALYSSQ